MKGDKVATETACCCEYVPCVCPTLTLANVTIRITFALPWSPACLTVPLNIPFSDVLTCESRVFAAHIFLDTVVCEGEGDRFCGAVNVFLSIVGECDCTSTENCTVEVVGWAEEDCAGGIANVEIV